MKNFSHSKIGVEFDCVRGFLFTVFATFFENSYKFVFFSLTACHPTCKTCTPDGEGCASCWEGGLLHQGQCVGRCPVGLYANTVGSCSRKYICI